jgi:PPM family protein phosphatase
MTDFVGPWRLSFAARTDVGRLRQSNEDSFLVLPPVFAVADGLGGHAAGDVASGLVTESLNVYFAPGAGPDPRADTAEWLRAAVRTANRRVLQSAAADTQLAGMASTCTLAFFDARLHLAHVGDTRAYVLRDGSFEQLTTDHTLIAQLVEAAPDAVPEALLDRHRNVLVRALGVADDLEVDVVESDVHDGDRLLICSDGLTGMLSDEQIRDILTMSTSAAQSADTLVDAANAAGGEDNITAVVVWVQAAVADAAA